METRKIETTDYLMIGWHAYFADKVYDFMVLRDRDPWEVYYREGQMPFPDWNFEEMAGTVTIGEERGWMPVDIDGNKLKNYFKRYANPETWQKVNRKFHETHEVAAICDGPSLTVEFTKPNGKVREMGYQMHEFPEEWHPSYQKACRLLRYLERQVPTPKKAYSAYFAGLPS
jgi:hypothetical protein